MATQQHCLVLFGRIAIKKKILLASAIIDHVDIGPLIHATFIAVIRSQYVRESVDQKMMNIYGGDDNYMITDSECFKQFTFYDLLRRTIICTCDQPHLYLYLSSDADCVEVILDPCGSIGADLIRETDAGFMLTYGQCRELFTMIIDNPCTCTRADYGDS